MNISSKSNNFPVENKDKLNLHYPAIKEEINEDVTLNDCDDNNSSSSIEIDGIGAEDVFTKVTNLARRQYVTYVRKLLESNYDTWCASQNGFIGYPPESWVNLAAQKYEERAVKSCMIMQLYRKTMLKIIAEIRRDTSYGKLNSNLKDTIINDNKKAEDEEIEICKKQSIDAETQTELNRVAENNHNQFGGDLNLIGIHEMRHECLSLQEKIQYFQEKLDEREKRIKEITKHDQCNNSNNDNNHKHDKLKKKMSMNYAVEKQDILSHHHHHHHHGQELKSHNRKRHLNEEISNNETVLPNLSNSTITGINNTKKRNITTTSINLYQQKDSSIIEDEIAKELENILGEKKDLEEEIFGDEPHNPQIDQILKEIEEAELPISVSVPVPVPVPIVNNSPYFIGDECNESQKQQDNNDKNYSKTINLGESLWPCELHMREKKLRNILSALTENGNLRHYERIRQRYIELFGEDSEDEFAPYSPTIEANEILVESCKKRIAPWIVKYLMIPMNDGLIGNRFLFKKLAKRLAHNIIMADQYPGEADVKQVVEDVFCHKTAINSIDDIDQMYLYNLF